MLYGLASNCMFNCNKETTFAKKKNDEKTYKQTMPRWRENTEAIFMKFRAQLKDTKQLQQSAVGKWKM